MGGVSPSRPEGSRASEPLCWEEGGGENSGARRHRVSEGSPGVGAWGSEVLRTQPHRQGPTPALRALSWESHQFR